jgi:hypothetical protein
MAVSPKSLNNLIPGGNCKNAVRVTLTLKPETVELLRMTGNMSEAVDKFIELIKQGCVQHDGMLNPLPRSGDRIEPKLESNDVHTSIETSNTPDREQKTEYHPAPDCWIETKTANQLVRTGRASRYRLDKLKDGDSFEDSEGIRWWRIDITDRNSYLRPFEHPTARVVYGRGECKTT